MDNVEVVLRRVEQSQLSLSCICRLEAACGSVFCNELEEEGSVALSQDVARASQRAGTREMLP